MINKQHICEPLEKSPEGEVVTIIQYQGIGEWCLELAESTGPFIIYYCPFCGKHLE